MELSIRDREVVTKAFSRIYRRTTKRKKKEILDQFTLITGYSRKYAARKLRNHRGSKKEAKKRGRKRLYGPKIVKVLHQIWVIMDMPCGKRLKPFMPKIIDSLERHGELNLTDEQKGLLLRMSSSTIDRLLRPYKLGLNLRGKATTKPGKILIERIPIKTFSEWRNTEPGYVEVDMVAHWGREFTRGVLLHVKQCRCSNRLGRDGDSEESFETEGGGGIRCDKGEVTL